MTATQIDLGKMLEDTLTLRFSKKAWGNRKEGDMAEITTSADKDLLGLRKTLIKCPEYNAVVNFQTATKRYLEGISGKCYFAPGYMVFRKSQAMMVVDYIEKQRVELGYLVEAFLRAYTMVIDEMETKLQGQFNRPDYPSVMKMRSKFDFVYSWVDFEVSSKLPEKMYEEEKIKAENAWKQTFEKIDLVLTESFAKIIQTLAVNLTPDPDGKRKRFKDASFENAIEFISTFKNRNVFDNRQLAALVAQAEEIIKGIDNPQGLKKDEKLMGSISQEFKAIECSLADMIEKSPARKFDFDE